MESKLRSGRYGCFGLSFDCRFIDGSQTLRADEDSFAVDFCVLKVWVFAGPVHGIVVAAEKLPSALHL